MCFPPSLPCPGSPRATLFTRWECPCSVAHFVYNSKIGFSHLNCWNSWRSHSCWAASRVTDLLVLYSSQLKSQLCGSVICLGDWDTHCLPLCSSSLLLSLWGADGLAKYNMSVSSPLACPLLLSAGAQYLPAQHFSGFCEYSNDTAVVGDVCMCPCHKVIWALCAFSGQGINTACHLGDFWQMRQITSMKPRPDTARQSAQWCITCTLFVPIFNSC